MTWRTKPLFVGLIVLGCGETGPEGNAVYLDFGDAEVVSFDAEPDVGTGGGSADAGSDAEPDAGPDAEPDADPVVHEAPLIDSFDPETGPWGVELTLRGTDLGSETRGASLWVGDGPTLEPGDAPDIVSWSESTVVLRVAFPGEGVVTLETDEGSVDAGEFMPSFVVGEPFELDDSEQVLTSVSLEPEHVAVLIDSEPPTVAEFDGDAWSSSELADVAVREDSLALHGDSNGQLAAFALTASTPPEIVAFTLDSGTWSEELTGIEVTDEYVLAGAADGAAVWYSDSDGWYRARPVDGDWQIDKGPKENPYTSRDLAQAAATSDGSLIMVYAKDTGSVLDDTGAPFARLMGPDDDVFSSEVRVGNDIDDYMTSIDLFGRGRGLVIKYCGSVASSGGDDPFRCDWGTLRQNGNTTRRSVNETEFNRHAFTGSSEAILRCDLDLGSILADDTDTDDVWVWPCLAQAALEIDPGGTFIPVFRYEGALVVVSER